MAGDKVSMPQLCGENWPTWKAKFRGLLAYNGWLCALEEPESVEGQKVSSQARGLMLIHTEDAYVKLIEGEPTAEKAWKKLEDIFEKRSNARMIQLRRKLTGLRLTKGKAIAEYLGEFRELKIDLEAAGQTVSEGELAVHALEGLPEEYATVVEFLELGEEELTLDVIQPKLMQREQKLKLRAEAGSMDGTSGGDGAVAYAAKHRGYSSSEKGRGSSNELGRSSEVRGGSSNPPTCYCCGKVGHMKAKCRLRDAECRKCGKRGHTEAVCRQSARASDRAEEKQEFAGVAFTAWGDDADLQERVWIVDSGSTQHVTADRSQFTSYRKLEREAEIAGICGESLIAVGIGEVQLKCKTPSGVSTVTLKEVRHAPRAHASLFALSKATDAEARVVLEERTAQVMTGGVVRREAVKRGGLWEIETVGKQRAFLAREPVRKNRVTATAKGPVRAESVVKKTVKVVEVDLEDLDDEIEGTGQPDETRKGGSAQFTIEVKNGPSAEFARPNPAAEEKGAQFTTEVKNGPSTYIRRQEARKLVESPEVARYPARVRRELVEWYRANVGAATEAVGAEEPEHGVEKTSQEKSDDGDSGAVWVTPKAKKTARKRSLTS